MRARPRPLSPSLALRLLRLLGGLVRALGHPLPFSRELAAIMTAAGHEPVCLPTAGGSLPINLFQQGNDAPVIAFPIANHDDNQHAANENLRLKNLWDAIEVFASFFASLNNGNN